MQQTTNSTFDKKLRGFQQEQMSPWGRLQYSTSFANIQRHLTGEPVQVLDVGGGNGVDSFAFAQQGHSVALLDPQAEMLAEAEAQAEEQDLADRVTFHQGSLYDIPAVFGSRKFDVILCHHVLQYVDDVERATKLLILALRPGGILSLMSINRYSEAYRRALLQPDLDPALDVLDQTTIRAVVFDTPIRVYSGAEIGEIVTATGGKVVGEYGVRNVCDYIADNERKWEPAFFAQLEKLEYAMSDTYPYYLLARNFQVIASR